MKLRFLLLFSPFLSLMMSPGAQAQSSAAPPPAPIVQPGAPGQPSKTIDPAHAAVPLNKPSAADVKFMQGMIMHHGQAVEMTELLARQGSSPEVKELGARISNSQSAEIIFMKRWLTERGYPLVDPADDMGSMAGMDMADMDMPMMPGMLTKKQMAALKAAHGPAFDHLFLTGMIQHHTGALTMVTDLFNTAGAGQDPTLFDFASEVTSGQTAEIHIMTLLLKKEKQ